MDGEWKEYFVFSRKERFAILFLVILIILLIYIPSIIGHSTSPHESMVWLPVDSVLIDRAGEIKETAPAGNPSVKNKLIKDASENFEGKPIATESGKHYELFFFNPNTASSETLEKLGVKERQVKTIQRYISKGGRFRKAEDLGRVYGMSEDEVKRLMPYVQIKPANRPSLKNSETDMQNQQPLNNTVTRPSTGSRGRYYQQTNGQKSLGNNVQLEVNAATRQDWERLPGIGATLATRIMTFRDKLGGFYSVLQVAETYGLPDSTYRKIMSLLTCDPASCRKLEINTATEEQLNDHPYFRGATATAIIRYRSEHGVFKDLADLKMIKSINAQVYNRILPYCSLKTP